MISSCDVLNAKRNSAVIEILLANDGVNSLPSTFMNSEQRRIRFRRLSIALMACCCCSSVWGQQIQLSEQGAADATDSVGIVRMELSSTNPDEFFSNGTPQATQLHQPDAITFEPVDLLPPTIIPPQPASSAEVPIILPPSVGGCADGDFVVLREDEEEKKKTKDESKKLNFSKLIREPYSVYRTDETSVAWLPGSGEDFGWVDWETDMYLKRGEDGGFVSTFNMHWLSGPESVPLPPRLYDFAIGYQSRGSLSNQFSYDLFTSVGVYSDFEGSARDGVRFPSHAVGMFHLNPSTDIVFGVDYLGRDNISILPVFGLSLRDVGIYGLRMDLVFPRPRIEYMLTDSHRLYLSGKTTGGNWDIEFPSGADHVMGYRDYRLTFGVESTDDDGDLSAWELGYVFGRSLELRGRPGDIEFDDAFMIRWVTRR